MLHDWCVHSVNDVDMWPMHIYFALLITNRPHKMWEWHTSTQRKLKVRQVNGPDFHVVFLLTGGLCSQPWLCSWDVQLVPRCADAQCQRASHQFVMWTHCWPVHTPELAGLHGKHRQPADTFHGKLCVCVVFQNSQDSFPVHTASYICVCVCVCGGVML